MTWKLEKMQLLCYSTCSIEKRSRRNYFLWAPFVWPLLQDWRWSWSPPAGGTAVLVQTPTDLLSYTMIQDKTEAFIIICPNNRMGSRKHGSKFLHPMGIHETSRICEAINFQFWFDRVSFWSDFCCTIKHVQRRLERTEPIRFHEATATCHVEAGGNWGFCVPWRRDDAGRPQIGRDWHFKLWHLVIYSETVQAWRNVL